MVLYIMKYYSAIKKDEIVPFATTETDLEGIIWNTSDWERHIIWFHSYEESRKTNE